MLWGNDLHDCFAHLRLRFINRQVQRGSVYFWQANELHIQKGNFRRRQSLPNGKDRRPEKLLPAGHLLFTSATPALIITFHLWSFHFDSIRETASSLAIGPHTQDTKESQKHKPKSFASINTAVASIVHVLISSLCVAQDLIALHYLVENGRQKNVKSILPLAINTKQGQISGKMSGLSLSTRSPMALFHKSTRLSLKDWRSIREFRSCYFIFQNESPIFHWSIYFFYFDHARYLDTPLSIDTLTRLLINNSADFVCCLPFKTIESYFINFELIFTPRHCLRWLLSCCVAMKTLPTATGTWHLFQWRISNCTESGGYRWIHSEKKNGWSVVVLLVRSKETNVWMAHWIRGVS